MIKYIDKILYGMMFMSMIVGVYLAVSGRLEWVG